MHFYYFQNHNHYQCFQVNALLRPAFMAPWDSFKISSVYLHTTKKATDQKLWSQTQPPPQSSVFIRLPSTSSISLLWLSPDSKRWQTAHGRPTWLYIVPIWCLLASGSSEENTGQGEAWWELWLYRVRKEDLPLGFKMNECRTWKVFSLRLVKRFLMLSTFRCTVTYAVLYVNYMVIKWGEKSLLHPSENAPCFSCPESLLLAPVLGIIIPLETV